MELELRHLRVVRAIADAGSVSRAAAVLRISQPALTAQLKRIEGAVGGVLFARERHGVAPTALGEFVLERARAVLPAVDELRRDVRQAAAQSPLRIRVTALPGPILAGLVRRLRGLLPDAELTAEAGHGTARLLDMVATEVTDCAVVGEVDGYPMPAPSGVECHPVVTEPVFALLPAGHPLARYDEVELAELAREPWALPPLADDRMWDAVRALVERVGAVPNVAYQGDGSPLVDLVRNGQAVALVQPTIVQQPGVVVRPIAGSPLRWRHAIAWRQRSPLAGFRDELLGFCREAYEQAADRSLAYQAWRARTAAVSQPVG